MFVARKIIFISLMSFIIFFVTIISCEVLFNIIHKINLNKSNPNEVTFYVLGGSTALGEPYEESLNFTKLIADKIGGKYKGKKIKIKMIANKGVRLIYNLTEFIKLMITDAQRNGVLFVYTGINEHINGDQQVEKHYIEKIFRKTFTGNLFLNALNRYVFNDNESSISKFEFLLDTLFSWSNRLGYEGYISSITGNLHDYPVGRDTKLSELNFEKLFECEKINDASLRISCVKGLNLSVLTYSYYFDWINYHNNPSPKNLKLLDRYYMQDPDFERPLPIINAAIKKITDRYSNISYVNFYERLKQVDGGFIGANFFTDAHHPNLKGIIILAENFLRALTGNKDYKIDQNQVVKKYKLDTEEAKNNLCLGRLEWYLYVLLRRKHSFVLARTMFYMQEKLGCNNVDLYKFRKALVYPLAPFIKPNVTFLKSKKFNEFLSKVHVEDYVKSRYKAAIKLSKDYGWIESYEYDEYVRALSL